MKRVLIVSMMLLGSTSFAKDLDKTIPAGNIRIFTLEHTNGNITITGTKDSSIHITTHKVLGDNNCYTVTEATDILLDMQTERLDLTIDHCVVDATISLPQTIAIEATLGTGNLTVQHMTGNLTVMMGSGTLTTVGSFPRQLLELGIGTLNATWETLPKPGAITFDVGTGDAILNFPKGSTIVTELNPRRASVVTNVTVTPDASFRVIGTMRDGKMMIQ